MLLGRVVRISILFAFAAVIAGGPGLHYAPFLGLHDCSDHDHVAEGPNVESESACGCGQSHPNNPSSESASKLSDERGHAHGCDGSCQFCQFFSQISLDLIQLPTIYCDPATGRGEGFSSSAVFVTAISSYFERGPPIA